MGTQHSTTGSMVCADPGVEVTKDKQLICFRHSRQQCVQVLVQVVPFGVVTAHRRIVNAGKDGEYPIQERQSEAHQAVFDALRQTGQSSQDVISNSKGDARGHYRRRHEDTLKSSLKRL
ncbi:hypothetical protein SprV_1002875600 [Sparganum proliferum]